MTLIILHILPDEKTRTSLVQKRAQICCGDHCVCVRSMLWMELRAAVGFLLCPKTNASSTRYVGHCGDDARTLCRSERIVFGCIITCLCVCSFARKFRTAREFSANVRRVCVFMLQTSQHTIHHMCVQQCTMCTQSKRRWFCVFVCTSVACCAWRVCVCAMLSGSGVYRWIAQTRAAATTIWLIMCVCAARSE